MQKKLLNNIDRPIGLNWTFQAGMHVPAFLISPGRELIFLMKFILNMV
jgi:hypothetical protein